MKSEDLRRLKVGSTWPRAHFQWEAFGGTSRGRSFRSFHVGEGFFYTSSHVDLKRLEVLIRVSFGGLSLEQ